jgi:hypothetical protein
MGEQAAAGLLCGRQSPYQTIPPQSPAAAHVGAPDAPVMKKRQPL